MPTIPIQLVLSSKSERRERYTSYGTEKTMHLKTKRLRQKQKNDRRLQPNGKCTKLTKTKVCFSIHPKTALITCTSLEVTVISTKNYHPIPRRTESERERLKGSLISSRGAESESEGESRKEGLLDFCISIFVIKCVAN
jgi:hypothetical protein